MSQNGDAVVVFIIGFGAGVLLSIWILSQLTTFNGQWHQAAVDHHAAHYDTKTGNFTWNDEAKDGPKPGRSEAAR